MMQAIKAARMVLCACNFHLSVLINDENNRFARANRAACTLEMYRARLLILMRRIKLEPEHMYVA